jgi:hypothetical protein
MIDQEAIKKISDLSRKAGFYQGLLEGLMMQCKKGNKVHYFDSEVFYKLELAIAREKENEK